jgi:NAD(P)-dependent dehydrogenase (short-subunit alcohol dehydrogenase family)
VPHEPSSILLTDRVVVVTGAARGIGRATARMCAAFGARVAVCDRLDEGLDDDPYALARVFDVRDTAARDAFVADVVRELGRVDVLVNNAGGTFFAPFLDVSAKGEEALSAENFGHVTALIRSVVPHMPSGGAIVNVTSIEAHQAAPGFAVYGAMKAALAHLTRTLALELAPHSIRVNAIAPDAIPTTGDHDLQAAMHAAGAVYDPAVVPPLGFLGEADDAAAVIVFLASDLSRFVTGTTVHVDGGNWAAGGWRRLAE